MLSTAIWSGIGRPSSEVELSPVIDELIDGVESAKRSPMSTVTKRALSLIGPLHLLMKVVEALGSEYESDTCALLLILETFK